MHGWASNDPRVFCGLNENSCSVSDGKMQICNREGERVLGLFWGTVDDTLGFNVGLSRIPDKIITAERHSTKGEFLRIIMSVFDPLGLLSPYSLYSKILMQEIWRSGVGWDDPIRNEEQVKWLIWIKNLKYMKECKV